MLKRLKALIKGWFVANRLIKQNHGKNMIFTLENVGDQCMELAYAKSYKEYNNIKHLAVITSKPEHAVFKYFEGQFDSLVKVKKSDFDALLLFYKSDLGQIFRKKHNEILCAYYTAFARNDLLLWNKYIRLSDLEKAIYRIPRETMPCKIKPLDNRAWIEELINNGTIRPGKTILLNPYANSMNGVSDDFWVNLAKLLRNKGYNILTGVCGSQKAINGTVAINFPLERTVSLVEACGWVIGLRSGFLDLCALSSTKIVVIENDTYHLTDACNLEYWWPQNKNIWSLRYNDEENMLEKVYDVLANQLAYCKDCQI